MLRKGFSLLEVIFGIFLIGVVVIYLLPSFNNIFLSFKKAKIDTNLVYLAESIVESLKAERISNPEIFEQIKEAEKFLYTKLDQEDLDKYDCYVINDDENEYLWKFKVVVNTRKDEGKMSNVELKASFPK